VILLASIIGMVSHVYLLNATQPIINTYMSSVHVLHPPYNIFITTAAYITSVIPTVGKVAIYYFIERYSPYKKTYNGIMFLLLLLLLNGEFLRMSVMNLLIGNPLKVVILQDGQAILVTLLSGLAIIFTMPSWKKQNVKKKISPNINAL
jgi:hypothetical protein